MTVLSTLALPTPAATHALGAALATVLKPGDLVILSGPVGAGKTVLTQGIGAGLGVPGRVTSPTFVIARTHLGGRLPLVHVDAYRLGSVAEVDDLDLDTDLADAVLVIEWGAGLVEALADRHLRVTMSRDEDSEARAAVIRGSDAAWNRRVAPLLAGFAVPLPGVFG